ncbi:MAG: quinone-dependent dihydroorotate dehydrogenase, partial [Pseudomonadota bacterium]
EVGTLTPKAQEGNPQPRVFRLRDDRAIINRLGFNNGGHAAALERLDARAGNPGLVGVNLGANKDSSDRIADYVTGVETFAAVAGYFMVNVSSPNTPGLRDLQAPEAVADLLGCVIEARDAIAKERGTAPVPVSIKLAPDINENDLAPVIDQIKRAGVDAIAVSNTTIARPADLKAPHAAASEVGGLSGAPLFDRSTAMLARVFEMTDGAIPLIGIGGITTGAQAVAKIEAGATAIQLYTGLVYAGPPLLLEIKSALVRTMNAAGVSSLSALTGQDSRAWAQKSFAA